MTNPIVNEILDKIKAIHDKKSNDYASDLNRYSNFERSSELASWFSNKYDKTFTTLIGVKLARLAELLSNDKPPANESISDSFLDLCTYCVLWMSYHERVNSLDKPGYSKDLQPLSKIIPCFHHSWTSSITGEGHYCINCKMTWIEYQASQNRR